MGELLAAAKREKAGMFWSQCRHGASGWIRCVPTTPHSYYVTLEITTESEERRRVRESSRLSDPPGRVSSHV